MIRNALVSEPTLFRPAAGRGVHLILQRPPVSAHRMGILLQNFSRFQPCHVACGTILAASALACTVRLRWRLLFSRKMNPFLLA